MRTVAVSGSGGFIGRRTVEMLRERGNVVREVPRISIDRFKTADALSGVETLFHLGAIAHARDVSAEDIRRANVDDALALARLASEKGARRVIFMSSIKAVADESDEPLGEDAPLRPSELYGRSKADAELALSAALEDSDTRLVIIRPPLVYGPGVRANFRTLIRLVARGLPLPLASVENCRSFVFLDNLVDAMLTADDDRADGRTFHVADGSDFSTPGLIRTIAGGLGVPARLFPFPPRLLRLMARAAGVPAAASRLIDSLPVDASSIRNELEWQPRVDPADAIRRTCAWYRATKV